MNDLKIKLFLIGGGLGSILLGLPYIYRVFGPAEAEVASWGFLSLYTGVTLTVLTIVTWRFKTRIAELILGLGYAFAAVIQVPPIAAWILFHGNLSLTDSPLPGAFKVHWGFSVPHMIVLIVCTIIVAEFFRWGKATEQIKCFVTGFLLVVLEVFVFILIMKKLPYMGPLYIGLALFIFLLITLYPLAGYVIGKKLSKDKIATNSILLGISPFLLIFFLLFCLRWINETNWFGFIVLLMSLAFPTTTVAVAKRVSN